MENPKRIVVVDDDPAIQDTLRMMLERKGYEVVTYGDGDPLVNGVIPLPDLFILDKQLPGVDGLDICRFLKTQDATRHVPVLMLSASPWLREEAEAVCADGFLEKPFRMQDLREVVGQLVL